MCANYGLVSKDRVHLMDLFEPTFDYKADIFPNYAGPILFSKHGTIEWRLARFGLVAPWVDDVKKFETHTMHEQRQLQVNQVSGTPGKKINFV